jgi:hypothetical protein
MNAQTDVKPDQSVSMKGVIPYIQVEGAMEAVKFYERAFGARELSRFPTDDGKRLMNCQIEINGGGMMVMDAMPEHGFAFQPTHSVTLQLLVDDVRPGSTAPSPRAARCSPHSSRCSGATNGAR